MDGQLYPFCPTSPIVHRYRQLHLTERFNEELFRTDRNVVELQRFATLEATLELFVTREHLAPNYLRGLSPKGCGVWEVKCWNEPPIRAFGMFMARDILVITHCEYRDNLGPYESQEWKDEIRRCRAYIRNLFPTYNSLTSSDVNQVISGALNEQYFRD